MTKLEKSIAVVLVLTFAFIAGVQAEKYRARATGDNYSDGYSNGVEAGNGEAIDGKYCKEMIARSKSK